MSNWITAVPDWRDRIRERRSLVPDLPLFREEAERALRIFKRLRIPDIYGRPTMAEACGPWMFPIVEALFGSFDPKANRRMIQEYFLMIPKKNGKSSTGGPIMLTAAIVNRRPEAEFNFIAPTIQIANIAFDQAMGTVRIDPELDKLFQCIPHKRTIQHRLTGASLQIKAADTDVVTGGKPVGTMIDETHVFASKSRADAIFVELRGALAARPDGFFFQTTTQSKEPPAGVFKEELTNARKVRDGELDLPLLPILYEYPEDMVEAEAWRDPSTWDMVNPNLGRSVDEGFLERELRKAQAEGRHKVALVVSQHFNVEIGMRLHGDRWGGADFWEAAARPGLKLEAILARSDVVTIGIDGGGLDDLLGAAVLGRDKETGQLMLWTHAWCDPIVLERRAQIAPKLLDLEKAGDLTICRESDTQDLDELIALIASIDERGLLPEEWGIGVDKSDGQHLLGPRLVEAGFEGNRVADIRQGTGLNGPILAVEKALYNGTFVHCGQPLMAWCVGNAKLELVKSAVAIHKADPGVAKIDPLIATFNAYDRMAAGPEPRGRSFWEDVA